MPGVHPAGVGPQSSGLATFGWYDIKLTIGLKEHITFGFAEDNPFAIGRILRKEVAHTVGRSPFDWLRAAAFSLVKWNPVQVE